MRRSILLFVFFLLPIFSSPLFAAEEDACKRLAEAEKYFRENPKYITREQLGIAYNNCGIQYANQKKWNLAERHLQKARTLNSTDPIISQSLASIIRGRGQEAFEANDLRSAREDFEKALRYDPNNANIKSWLSQTSYRLESHTDILKETSREERHGRWLVRIQDGLPSQNTQDIFQKLEEVSNQVGEDFHYWIKHPMVIILTDTSSFQQIHSGPGWAGALNDGRIKVPVTGGYEDPLLFKGVLAHEYTHSVINDLSHGHFVPFWFHEGMAEYEERKAMGKDPRAPENFQLLTAAVAQNGLHTMSFLSQENAAASMSTEQAWLAYQQALSFILYLEEIYYFHSLESILKELGKGASVEDAVVQGVGRNLQFLEEEWLAWLKRI